MNQFFIFIYYFLYFQELIIVILYKYRSNENFTRLKNYRPINLFNIIAKTIKFIQVITNNFRNRSNIFLQNIILGDGNDNILKSLYINSKKFFMQLRTNARLHHFL